VVNVNRIARAADEHSLVLLDELGSATDPEEGAALAVAVAEHFLEVRAWCLITTHLTSLKVYAAKHESVLNASVGFDEAALAPTYELRLGVPGASAGLNIAARLGLDAVIVANARAQMSTQQESAKRWRNVQQRWSGSALGWNSRAGWSSANARASWSEGWRR
jgi:DNA mismatch repair protein MutS2